MTSTYDLDVATHLAVNVTTNGSSTNNGTGLGATPDAEQCLTFLVTAYFGVYGAICVVGLLGNGLSIVVLRWEGKRLHAATFLLQMLAVSDSFFLIVSGVSFALSVGNIVRQDLFGTANSFASVYEWPFIYISRLISVWMTVLIAANRYIAICKPFKAHQLCSMRVVVVQVLAVYVFSLLFCLPRFFESRLRFDDATAAWLTEPTAMAGDRLYQILYMAVVYSFGTFLVPLCTLTVLNVCLIRELCAAKRRRLASGIRQEDDEQGLTYVMIIIMIIFLCCQTPALISDILGYVLSSDSACDSFPNIFQHICNLIVCTNSAINFFVYFAFRKQFRDRLSSCFNNLCRRGSPQLRRKRSFVTEYGRSETLYLAGANVNGSLQQANETEQNCKKETNMRLENTNTKKMDA